MLRETPALARVTETPAADIESTKFRGNRRADENQDQRSQDRQSAAIKKTEDERDAAKNLQPRQIKRESHADEPRQRLVIVDVVRELDRIENFHHAGVNKNSTDDHVQNSPNNLHLNDSS